ncbi:MAG: sigma-70 family RNA polymerase sigma factor [Bellilinea sp.]|nr:sigma-70 family RNA polymerase sigma factor [Bellilinea sp.]
MEELEIVEGLRSQQPQAAMAALFEKYADRVYHLAVGLLGDEDAAEDVVQDTFLAVFRNRLQFEGRSSAGTWLYRIAYNLSLDRLRAKQTLPLPDDDGTDEMDNPSPLPREFVEWRWLPEELIQNQQQRKALTEAIQTLSPALRAVFILRDVEELSTEETAAILSISAAAVKVRLHRARLELREKLAAFFAAQEKGTTQ